MPRYIDAEKITFDLSGLAYILPTDMHKIGEYFMRQLQAMPVEDVRPVVKGPSEQPEKAEYIPDTKAIPSKRDCVDLAERVTATFYSEENEEWGQKTVTIADILDSVCDDYTVLPSAQPEIIRCKDCVNWDREWQNDRSPGYHYCPYVGGMRKADFFCADAIKER